MKAIPRADEPATLTAFRSAQPTATWDRMREDAFHEGQQSYLDIKATLVRVQRGLCAYCERSLADKLDDDAIASKRSQQRVEHFHPKSDTTGIINWALHWPNLLVVCHGGSERPAGGGPIDLDRYLPPLPDNLSCDQFKDYQIGGGRLDENPEGFILDPHEVPAFPRLFRFAPDGTPEPDHPNCAITTIPGNRHADTSTLVLETIKHLNLGCARLNRTRNIVRSQLEKRIRTIRLRNVGVPAHDIELGLARSLFPGKPGLPWHRFFTIIRWRLGEIAEERLREIYYAG